MSSVFHRVPFHHYPVAVRGEGVYLCDSEGNQYLDGSGGAAVSSVGHGHPAVIAAVQRQVGDLAYAHTAFFTNHPQEQLATELSIRFGHVDARVYFVSGGSEANEAAIKLVRQYWAARGQTRKRLMISREQSYHGNTLGALALSGNPQRRELYGPVLMDWPKIDPCYEYRHRGAGESIDDYAIRSGNSLEEAVATHGAENIAAFFAETVVGATLGAVPAVPGYFQRIREICDRHDILLVLDEVMSGSGRTGTWFAFEQEDIVPDIVTIAKGLAGGYQPLGAAICRREIYDTIIEQSGSFAHGHTYIGHATACAAGLAVLGVIHEDKLLENVQRLGVLLREELNDALMNHPHVGDIRGRGLFIGIELVRDRENRTPPPSRLGLPEKIKHAAMANGLVCYPGGGTADGDAGAHILLAPPYVFNVKNIDELVTKLAASLASVKF